jgi:threonyl-tRNA synthetase
METSMSAASIDLVLPDGTVRKVPAGSTTLDVAKGIGSGLARAAVAGVLDGEVYDLPRPLPRGGKFRVLTRKDPEALEVLRHSAAHLLAMAVLELHPGTDLGFGPATEEGFYYDFRTPEPLTEEDLPKIEARMREIAAQGRPYARIELDRERAKERLRSVGYALKVPHVDEIPEDAISFYDSGGFTDMCEGPHVPDTSWLSAVRLLSVSGAYWRGDAKGLPMQRVHGTAFFTQEELDAHLRRLEEAKARDHRRIGREMDLFSFHPEGPGFPFWHPKGVVLWNELTGLVREQLRRRGYGEVKTPIVLSDELWKRSGHWDHFRDNMYFVEIEERAFAVKPMNCPGTCLVFGSSPKSYRDLPLRLAELSPLHRNELSGTLHGLLRVRAMTQDDAHVFCEPQDMPREIADMVDMLKVVYPALGFPLDQVTVRLATRPESRLGTDAQWDEAEAALAEAMRAEGMDFRPAPGEGAFYGPKLEFHVADCLGRTWQCGTIQIDYSMPARFGLEYTGRDGHKHVPVMIHRAILGSFERLIGVLIEHHAGKFPLWLAPEQARVLPITTAQDDYARSVLARLREAGLRAEADLRGEKVGAKIRQATLERVPYMLVVGAREAEAGTVAVRERSGEDRGATALDAFVAATRERIAARR